MDMKLSQFWKILRQGSSTYAKHGLISKYTHTYIAFSYVRIYVHMDWIILLYWQTDSSILLALLSQQKDDDDEYSFKCDAWNRQIEWQIWIEYIYSTNETKDELRICDVTLMLESMIQIQSAHTHHDDERNQLLIHIHVHK